MPALFLSMFQRFGGWKFIILAGLAIVIGLAFYRYHLRLDAALARADLAEQGLALSQAANADNLATIKAMRLARQESETALVDESNRRRAVEHSLSEMEKRLDAVPSDGCVGPAVRSVLDGLRTRQP